MGCAIRVFKKPRGYIHVIKFLMALAAAYTTLDFSTKLEFNIPCNAELDKTVYVSVHHPYNVLWSSTEERGNDGQAIKVRWYGLTSKNLTKVIKQEKFHLQERILKLEYSDKYWNNLKCDNDEELRLMRSIKLPFDYARTASLFATCAITSMCFSFVTLFMSMIVDPKAAKLKQAFKIEIEKVVAPAFFAMLEIAYSNSYIAYMEKQGNMFSLEYMCHITKRQNLIAILKKS